MGLTVKLTAKHKDGTTDSLRITQLPGAPKGKKRFRIQYKSGGYDGDAYDAKCARSNFLAFTNGWKVKQS